VLNPRVDESEVEGVPVLDPCVLRTAIRLANALEPLNYQRPMPLVERLVAADEQRRRLLRIEHRAQRHHHLARPGDPSALMRFVQRRDVAAINSHIISPNTPAI
jgi:hypothetical protein